MAEVNNKKISSLGNKLKIPTDQTIKADRDALMANAKALTNSSGWIGGPDTGLAGADPVSQKRVSSVATTLSSYYSDLYFSEIRAKVSALELDRRYYLELQDRYTRQQLNDFEWNRLLDIHTDETNAGWYTTDRDIANEEAEGSQEWQKNMEDLDGKIGSALGQDLKFMTDFRKRSYLAGVLAMASRVSPYRLVNKADSDKNELRDGCNTGIFYTFEDARHDPPDSGPWWVPKFLNPDTSGSAPPGYRSILETSFNATVWLADASERFFASNIYSQRGQSTAAMKLSMSQNNVKSIRKNWLENDVGFRKRRTELAIELRKLREDAENNAGGALNYLSELSSIRDNFLNSLGEVCAKAITCFSGFQTAWGLGGIVPPPLP